MAVFYKYEYTNKTMNIHPCADLNEIESQPGLQNSANFVFTSS